MSSSNEVCFLEEIAISNMYGTELEKKHVANLISYLINDPNNIEKIVELAVVIEEIKRREITHMDWNCCFCDKCERFHSCRIKWYRGERQMTQYCCSYCQNFDRCLAKFQKLEKSRRIVSEIFMININGNDEEVELARNITNNITDLDCLIKLGVLAEEIRTREITRMKWNCCPQCSKYNNCRIKWHRGEKEMDDYCCSYCQNYKECLEKYRKQAAKEVRLLEDIFVINLFGGDDEVKSLGSLIDNMGSPQTIIKMAAMAENIKTREITGFHSHCCFKCNDLPNCDINIERKASGDAETCCSYCGRYRDCLDKTHKTGRSMEPEK